MPAMPSLANDQQSRTGRTGCGPLCQTVLVRVSLGIWPIEASGRRELGVDAPVVTVMDPVVPGLMARQWPVAWCNGFGRDSRLPVSYLDAAVSSCAAMHAGQV